MIINPYAFGGGGGGGGAYRYYRILILSNNGNPRCAIAEVEFRATHGGSDLTSPSAAAAGAASASNTEGGYPWSLSYSAAFDDNVVYGGTPETCAQWLTSAFPSYPLWLKYDFGTPTVVTEMAMIAQHSTETASPSPSPKDFKVQGSDDDSTWTDLIAPASQTGWTPAEQRIFSW